MTSPVPARTGTARDDQRFEWAPRSLTGAPGLVVSATYEPDDDRIREAVRTLSHDKRKSEDAA